MLDVVKTETDVAAEQTTLERYLRLKGEADKFLEDARAEALERASAAIAELNALGGAQYRLANSAASKRAKRTKSDLPPKYRHPTDHAKTWIGRGKTPHWMLELIESGDGKSKGDFVNPERA